ncbi:MULTISPECIES: hypothetical protein [unclassified Micromonospora]|uniref:hypothetical protein n=1 Tax=unclassified Micromonospora TaxID=2617518 RepID=UPI0033D69851
MAKLGVVRNDSNRPVMTVNSEQGAGDVFEANKDKDCDGWAVTFPWATRKDKFLWIATKGDCYRFHEKSVGGKNVIEGCGMDGKITDWLDTPSGADIEAVVDAEEN